jgi:hypothetical protein
MPQNVNGYRKIIIYITQDGMNVNVIDYSKAFTGAMTR